MIISNYFCLFCIEMYVVTPHLWLVGCFGFRGPLRQYFSLYWAASQSEGDRGE